MEGESDYFIGIDPAVDGKDLSCIVQGERNVDGSIMIQSVRYFVVCGDLNTGVWINVGG